MVGTLPGAVMRPSTISVSGALIHPLRVSPLPVSKLQVPLMSPGNSAPLLQKRSVWLKSGSSVRFGLRSVRKTRFQPGSEVIIGTGTGSSSMLLVSTAQVSLTVGVGTSTSMPGGTSLAIRAPSPQVKP